MAGERRAAAASGGGACAPGWGWGRRRRLEQGGKGRRKPPAPAGRGCGESAARLEPPGFHGGACPSLSASANPGAGPCAERFQHLPGLDSARRLGDAGAGRGFRCSPGAKARPATRARSGAPRGSSALSPQCGLRAWGGVSPAVTPLCPTAPGPCSGCRGAISAPCTQSRGARQHLAPASKGGQGPWRQHTAPRASPCEQQRWVSSPPPRSWAR